MPRLSVNGINLNYRFDGTEGKPVLLFSNSLMSNLHMWDTQVAKLSSDFHILRYDSRGHGQSDAHPTHLIAHLGCTPIDSPDINIAR